MRALSRVMALWRGQSLLLGWGLVVSLGTLATGVGLMTVSGGFVAGMALGAAGAAPLVLRVLGPARVVMRYGERMVTHDATFRALAELRVWFFRGLASRAAGGLAFRRAGDVLARLVNDIEALDGVYLRILVPLAGAVLLLPVLAVVLGRIEPWLAAAVVALFAASAFVLPLAAARASRASGTRLVTAGAGLRVAMLDLLTGLREVRAFGAEGRMLAAVQARESTLLAAQHEMAMRGARAGALAFLCGQAAILTALLAVDGHPESAAIVVFLVVAAFEAVGGLSAAGALAGRVVAAAERVVATAEGPSDAPPAPAAPAPLPASNTLRFDGVVFRWRPDRAPVFDGLTLDIQGGTRVALLGPSGAGKSTLAALALKVAIPERGSISLGGVDLATLSAPDLRRRIGWLSQATHLFDDSVRANLLLAQPDADDAALWAALDAARIGDFVRALPDQLDAYLGEAGARASGGQGRRLALARALLSPAPVLILDEPCAGLDAETERAFFATLNETAPGRTIILIAHRLTGVERLDRIWRISAGRAVAAAG